MNRLPLLAALLAAILSPIAASAQLVPVETKEQRDKRMSWWRDARFGMFIHWGVYSVPAGEWRGKPVGGIGEWIMNSAKISIKDYEKLPPQFNPIDFNADEWVQIAKNAGMKYIVITSKHHDGFAMFDSKVSDYTITKATPFKRDPIKELAAACKKYGLRLCFYHSIMDWHHYDYLPRREWDKRPVAAVQYDRYIAYMKAQLKELITNYGDIGVLWFDGEWEPTWKNNNGQDLYAYVRSLKPDIIINNRVDKGRQGMQGMTASAKFAGDFGTPEQEIPGTGLPGVDWESCMTMNDTWGFKKDDHNWKTTQTLVRNLADIASKGGNFLLNVGPTNEGLIPGPSVQRLKEVGDWMKVNGESIHGTSPNPFPRLAYRCTRKPGKLYIHVFDWPATRTIELPGLKNPVKNAYLLADKKAQLNVSQKDSGVTITLPSSAPDTNDSVVAVEISGEPTIEVVPLRQSSNGELKLRAVEATVHGSTARYENPPDCIGFWTDDKDWVSWDAEISQPGKYAIELTYACENGSGGSKFAVSAGDASVDYTVAETGSWQSFKTIKVGEFGIPSPRRMTFSVKALSKPGYAVMNLKQVRLVKG